MKRIAFLAASMLLLAACGSNDEEAEAAEPAPQIAYDGYSYVSNFVELDDGLRMHYLDEGAGDPVLMIHGVPTQAYLWRNVIPALSDSHRVLAIDLLNFGLSDKTEPLTPAQHSERVGQFIDALELEDVTLVIHDWGGPIGLGYAAANPENVKSIAFFETPVFPIPNIDAVPEEFAQNVLDPVAAKTSVIENNFLIECLVLTPGCGGSVREWTDAERDVYRAPFVDQDSREQLLLFPQHLPFLDNTNHPLYDPDGPGGEEPQESPSLAFVQNNMQYLFGSDIPKLYIYAQPGTIPNATAVVDELQSVMTNLEVDSVGSETAPALHFIQEDVPDELGAALSQFLDQQ